MRGGVDEGPCFNYWRLSYRRKFLRTCWSGLVFLPLLALLQLSGLLGWLVEWSFPFVRWPDELGWTLVGLFTVGNVVQAAYTYVRWRREVAEPPDSGNPPLIPAGIT